MRFINDFTSEELWRIEFNFNIKKVRYSSINKIVIVIIMSETYNYETIGINSKNGKIVWRLDLGGFNSVITDDENYLYFYNDGLLKISCIDGNQNKTAIKDVGHRLHHRRISIRRVLKDKLYYHGVNDAGRPNHMFGQINLQTNLIEWEYKLLDLESKEIELKDWIPSNESKHLITSLKPVKQTIHFDPNDPKNIPYRTIDKGVLKDRNNLYSK